MKEPFVRYLDGTRVPLSSAATRELAEIAGGRLRHDLVPDADLIIRRYAAILLQERMAAATS